MRDVAAADRRAAGAAVGLDDVAVDPHRALAERARSRPPSAATGRPAAGSRPCARPACRGVASRCLRSPVEPGSIPYSDVTQPRAAPAHPRRHRLLDHRRADEPGGADLEEDRARVADGMKSSSIAIGRSSSGARPSARRHAATASVAGSTRSTSVSGSCRNRPRRRGTRPGRRCTGSGSRPRGRGRCRRRARASGLGHLAGDLLGRRDQRDVAAEDALEHRPDQRVVRAAEDDGVDVGVASAAAA